MILKGNILVIPCLPIGGGGTRNPSIKNWIPAGVYPVLDSRLRGNDRLVLVNARMRGRNDNRKECQKL